MDLTRNDNITALEKLKFLGKISYKGNLRYLSSDNIQVYCPHHPEKNPSLRIQLDRGVWTCFSCKRDGNINTLCHELVHLSAREFLGIPEEFTLFPSIRSQPVKPQATFPPLVILGFTYPALSMRNTYTYLKKRKITEEIAENMKMMYSPECAINGQIMKDRLLIPMFNNKNEIVNVECRSLDPDTNPPKVLYPKDTFKPLYEEYNLDRNQPLYIVEGLMDLARLREDSRFANSTAVFGTGLPDHIRDALNYFDKITLIPDNDAPGLAFADRLKETFKDKFSILRIRDSMIKDVGDIPISVKEFYDQNGFILGDSFIF